MSEQIDLADEETFTHHVSDEALEGAAGVEEFGPSQNHGTGTMAMGCCG